MPGPECQPPRKAFAALLGFLARGPAHAVPAVPGRAAMVELTRPDGARRKAAAAALSVALARGLIAASPGSGAAVRRGKVTAYQLTGEGRAALRRWLSDPDSAFQDQHRALSVRADPQAGRIMVNLQESPLAALARIKGRDGGPFLDPDQVQAGERLRADFTRGQLLPGLGQRWEPVRVGRSTGASAGVADLSDAALAARLRVEAAIAAVGPELSGALIDVCCFLKGLEQVERERQWPARSAKLMIRTALSALARHYAEPGRRSGR